MKPWGRRDTWCPNNGSSTPQRQASPDDRRRLDLVIYGSAAIRPSSRLSRAMVSPTPARPRRMERFCASPTDASKPPTLSSRARALRARLRSGWAVERGRSEAGPAPSCPPRAQSPAGCASACESCLGPPLVEYALRGGSASRWSHRAWTRPGPAHADAPALDEVLHLADPAAWPSRLPLR